MSRTAYPQPVSRGPDRRVQYDPWIEHLAWLMDSSIGIGRFRMGLDGIIGLVPGFGDVAGSLVSMLIVMRAVRAGVPRIAVARMTANIAIDTLFGAVPLLGDLFDIGYKANLKNLLIYQESLASAGNARHWAFFALLAAGLLAILALPVAVGVLLLRAI